MSEINIILALLAKMMQTEVRASPRYRKLEKIYLYILQVFKEE